MPANNNVVGDLALLTLLRGMPAKIIANFTNWVCLR